MFRLYRLGYFLSMPEVEYELVRTKHPLLRNPAIHFYLQNTVFEKPMFHPLHGIGKIRV